MERLIISVTVGYMLKVLKANKITKTFKREFAAIRHGDYIEFINLVKGKIPFLVVYHEGSITSGTLPPSQDDIDFALLLKAGPSLKLFYKNCKNHYGEISDKDISDETFEHAALFEISLRIHANNYKLLKQREELVNVISKLASFKEMSQSEIEKIHAGRHFLNMIKHNKNQFPSWTAGVNALASAYEVLNKYGLTAV
jgi:hypothetical protein